MQIGPYLYQVVGNISYIISYIIIIYFFSRKIILNFFFRNIFFIFFFAKNMPKKRKSTANRQNIQIYHMKQKLKEEIAEKPRDALLEKK